MLPLGCRVGIVVFPTTTEIYYVKENLMPFLFPVSFLFLYFLHSLHTNTSESSHPPRSTRPWVHTLRVSITHWTSPHWSCNPSFPETLKKTLCFPRSGGEAFEPTLHTTRHSQDGLGRSPCGESYPEEYTNHPWRASPRFDCPQTFAGSMARLQNKQNGLAAS